MYAIRSYYEPTRIASFYLFLVEPNASRSVHFRIHFGRMRVIAHVATAINAHLQRSVRRHMHIATAIEYHIAILYHQMFGIDIARTINLGHLFFGRTVGFYVTRTGNYGSNQRRMNGIDSYIARAANRITSYNVCYTKLLRIVSFRLLFFL